MRYRTSLLALMLGLGMYGVGPVITKFTPFGAAPAMAHDSGSKGGSDHSGPGGGDDDNDGGSDHSGPGGGGSDDDNDGSDDHGGNDNDNG